MRHRLEHSTETIRVVHTADECHGKPDCCPIHNMTDHHMRSFPQHWRSDRKLMERICPHGIGHPDPDHMASLKLTRHPDDYWAEGVHGCDGCCSDPWYRTSWWRVLGPDEELWCETSSEEEARKAMRPGDRLERLYRKTEEQWRNA